MRRPESEEHSAYHWHSIKSLFLGSPGGGGGARLVLGGCSSALETNLVCAWLQEVEVKYQLP